MLRTLILASLMSALTLAASPTIWTAINVSPTVFQAEANLIQFPSGANFLIDAGDPNENLLPFLQKEGIRHFKGIVITHAHRDHYTGLLKILDSGIKTDTLYMRMPEKALCSEPEWGCTFKVMNKFWKDVEKRGVKARWFNDLEFLHEESGITLRALRSVPGIGPPLGQTNVNGMSPLIRLIVGRTKVLFTGDLDPVTAEYFLRTMKAPQADIIQAPHHGGEPFPSDQFFDIVQPEAIIVNTTAGNWTRPITQRLREYIKRNSLKQYVTGIDGNIRVYMDGEKYWIKTDITAAKTDTLTSAIPRRGTVLLRQ